MTESRHHTRATSRCTRRTAYGNSEPRLTGAQRGALELAASRQTGQVSAGHKYPTPNSTLLSLRKRGLLEHIGTWGPYYDIRICYRITPAGRAALERSR